MSYGIINDIIFKIVFGSEENAPVLVALLNALLGYSGGDKIRSVQILNPSIDKEFLKQKNAILDIKAVDCSGRHFNIEVQLEAETGYVKRTIYYLARLYSSQLETGDNYNALSKTISISILDYILFKNITDLQNIYRFKNIKNDHELSDIIELHYIELPKYDKDKPHAAKTPFEKWLHILKFSELYQDYTQAIPDELIVEEGIEMAVTAYRKALTKGEVREIIEFRHKAIKDEATKLDNARKQGIAEGEVIGIAKGIAEGEVIGEARGEVKGEIKGLIKSARIMLELGHSKAEIAEKLGLNESEF